MLKKDTHSRIDLSTKQIAILVLCVIISVILRLWFVNYRSADYTVFLRGWFNYIHQQGGMNAFKHIFADYNVPYLYLLAIGNYLHLNSIWTVKIWAAAFDVLGAWFIYKIILFIKGNTWQALLSAYLYLLLPSIVILSAMWGQADGIYTSVILGGIYYYIRNQSWLGSFYIGLAFSFKLQTIFMFPVILLWVICRKVSWKSLVMIPVVYFIFFIPVILVQGDLKNYLTVYIDQSSKNHDFSTSLPNFGAIAQFLGRAIGLHDILPDQTSTLKDSLWLIQLIVSCIIGLGFLYLGWKKSDQLNSRGMILTATVSTFLFPMILPSMHERYLYTSVSLLYVCAWIFGSWMILSFIIAEVINIILYYEFLARSTKDLLPRVEARLHGRPYLGTRAIHFGPDPMENFLPKFASWKHISPHFAYAIFNCIALGLLFFYLGAIRYKNERNKSAPME